MTRETQIGLSLVLVLCGVFGFFVYKKVNEPTTAIATASPDGDESPAETPTPELPPAAESQQPQPASQTPLVASAADPLQVKPAATNRLLPDTPTTTSPRIPVEPRTPPLSDDDFDGPAPKIAAAQPARPNLPTLIPDDEGDPFGAPRQSAEPEPELEPARSSGAMEVTSATVPDDSDDPFGAPAAGQPSGAKEAEVFDGPQVAEIKPAPETDDDPFGAPAATAAPARTPPKLPTITEDSFDGPARQAEPAEADPFGAPQNPVAMEAPEATTEKEPEPAAEENGFDAPRSANPVRLSQPVAEEPEADPFGAPEPKTAAAAPATLGEPEFESQPAPRAAPALRLPTETADDAPDGFEPPVRLQQPEAVELTRSASANDDPFGAATAESTTEVQRNEPALDAAAPQSAEPELAAPQQVVIEPKGTVPRPAPAMPLDDQEDFPAVRPDPPVRSVPRPVAIELPKAGAITADQHVVEPNQNFWTLAQRRYGAGRYSEALAAHNKQTIPDPTHIKPGTIVSLPPAEVLEQQFPDLIPKTAAPQVDPKSVVAGPGQYVIQDGDSFWKISKKVYGDPRYWDALQKHNGETSKLPALKPGTIISTPPVAALEQKFANLITAPAAKATTPPGVALREPAAEGDAGLFEAADGQPLYRVGQGDTLSSIARATLGRSSRWVQILHLNRETLKDGNDLTPGTVLRMPADATQVQISGLDRDRR